MIESGKAEDECSNIYFFLPSITDRSEDINKYLNNVSIFPVDITQSQLNAWAGTDFDPSKPDLFGIEKNTMADAVVKFLKHIMRFPIAIWSATQTAFFRVERLRCKLNG